MMTGSVEEPRCSLVVRAYNEEEHLGRLLEGVFQQTIKNVEVILVDSGSTDGTLAVAAAYPVQVVHIPPGEFSFGRSLNLGIAQAKGEYIIIASAHVYPVYPDWLEHLLAPFADPEIALAYGKQRGNVSAKFSEKQVFLRWYPESPVPRQAHPFCNNANAAIRRSLWEMQPYDETLSGLEDLAWARWAIGQGYFLSYVPEAEVAHVHHETPRLVYNRYRREAMAFKRLFPQERFGFVHFLGLAVSNILSDLWHAARQGALSGNLASIFWFRLMQFWGTYQGYRRPGPLTTQLRETFYYPHGFNASHVPVRRKVEPIRYNGS